MTSAIEELKKQIQHLSVQDRASEAKTGVLEKISIYIRLLFRIIEKLINNAA